MIEPILNATQILPNIKSIAANDNEIAIIPDCNNSALTFGPTFSLLKLTSEFKLSDRVFLISGINLLLSPFFNFIKKSPFYQIFNINIS